MVLVVNFLIYYFSLFVPIFDLVHAVDAIIIPLKQLRASQNHLWNMSDDRENAICSCICIYMYNISLKNNQMLLAVYTGYLLPPHCYRSYIATKKLKKYKKNNSKTFDGKQKSLVKLCS